MAPLLMTFTGLQEANSAQFDGVRAAHRLDLSMYIPADEVGRVCYHCHASYAWIHGSLPPVADGELEYAETERNLFR